MNDEKNKAIHALIGEEKLRELGLDPCWHELGDGRTVEVNGRREFWYPCKNCKKEVSSRRVFSNPNYESETLPDNIRVAMVTAAVEKFGEMNVGFRIRTKIDGPTVDFTTAAMMLPAPAIAEAISSLLEREEHTTNSDTEKKIHNP